MKHSYWLLFVNKVFTGSPSNPCSPGNPGYPWSPLVPLHPSRPGRPGPPAGPGWPWTHKQIVKSVLLCWTNQRSPDGDRDETSYRDSVQTRKTFNADGSLKPQADKKPSVWYPCVVRWHVTTQRAVIGWNQQTHESVGHLGFKQKEIYSQHPL